MSLWLRWKNDVRFHVLFIRFSVILGQWVGDNERLSAMEPDLRLKRSLPQVGLEPGITRSAGQGLTH